MRRLPPVYSPLSVAAVVRSAGGGLGGRGRALAALSRHLSDRFNADAVALTATGTQALQVALGLVPVSGAERPVVALPAYSCFDLVSAAVGADVRVRFYDVDPVTLAPDLSSLRVALAAGVSVVVAGSLYGYVLPWDDLRAVCDQYGALLVEDAAQGVGTARGSGGTLGDATVLSFGRGKGWTGGGGGAVLLRGERFTGMAPIDLPVQSAIRGARTAIVTLAAWALGRPALYGIPAGVPQLGLGETRYHDPRSPEGIGGFSARLALRTSGDAQAVVHGRRERWRRWHQLISEGDPGQDQVVICEPIGGAEASTFLRCAVLVRDAGRVETILKDTRHFGVESGYPMPLDQLPSAMMVRVGGGGSVFTGATELASKLITLPAHHWVQDRDVQAVLRALIDGE